MLKNYIQKVAENIDLTCDEAKQAMDIIMLGKASEVQIAAFMSIMRMKGETVDEITGFALKMREHATKIDAPYDKPLIDTCGTGGDKSNTFNISTISAFVACGAGVYVAKHGNRAVSGKCGSADLLKELGVNIDIPVSKVKDCLFDVGIAFLFAPAFHPAMKYAVGPRKELGIRTFFNILGPITNPAFVERQVVGLFSSKLIEKIATVLKNMGTKKAMVFHSKDGLDEISLSDDTDVCELQECGTIKKYVLNPEDFGFEKVLKQEFVGGDAVVNAKIALEILKGNKSPKLDVVILNSGAAIYTSGIAKSLKEGVEKAKKSISSGAALSKLEKLIEFTKRN